MLPGEITDWLLSENETVRKHSEGIQSIGRDGRPVNVTNCRSARQRGVVWHPRRSKPEENNKATAEQRRGLVWYGTEPSYPAKYRLTITHPALRQTVRPGVMEVACYRWSRGCKQPHRLFRIPQGLGSGRWFLPAAGNYAHQPQARQQHSPGFRLGNRGQQERSASIQYANNHTIVIDRDPIPHSF